MNRVLIFKEWTNKVNKQDSYSKGLQFYQIRQKFGNTKFKHTTPTFVIKHFINCIK